MLLNNDTKKREDYWWLGWVELSSYQMNLLLLYLVQILVLLLRVMIQGVLKKFGRKTEESEHNLLWL